jgi:hypothetical protein
MTKNTSTYRSQILPSNHLDVLVHAFTGAARAYGLAYVGRSTLLFLLKVLQIVRGGKGSFRLALRLAFCGRDAKQFAAVFGWFAFAWKLINNSLRVWTGNDVPQRWQGFIAGTVGGLAIALEKPERQSAIAQQLLVRAAQAVYNHLKANDIVHFPHGDSLLFIACSSQIMYAYAMRPESLDPDFYKFMIQAARVPKDVLEFNRERMRSAERVVGQGAINVPWDKERALALFTKHKGLASRVQEMLHSLDPRRMSIPCTLLHADISSCTGNSVERWYKVFKTILPVYAALNIVPMLVFKLAKLYRAPATTLTRVLVDTVRSSAFLGTFVAVYQYAACTQRNLLSFLPFPMAGWDNKYLYGLYGTLSSTSIFMEHKGRRSELALYVLPKAMESIIRIMVDKRWMFRLRHPNVVMSCLAMGILMSFYQTDPDTMSPWLRGLMVRILGRN